MATAMKKTVILLIFLNVIFTGTTLAVCNEKPPEGDELEKAWKAKIVESIANYGRYSSYTLESITPMGNKRIARLIKLERKCKEFQFEVSLSTTCVPEVSLTPLESCQRTK